MVCGCLAAVFARLPPVGQARAPGGGLCVCLLALLIFDFLNFGSRLPRKVGNLFAGGLSLADEVQTLRFSHGFTMDLSRCYRFDKTKFSCPLHFNM